jgi:protein YIPF6
MQNCWEERCKKKKKICLKLNKYFAFFFNKTRSFFQSVCVIGYCLFPLAFGALLIAIISIWLKTVIFRGIVVLVTLLWSIFASLGFIGALVPSNRKFLGTYPIILFYIVLAWLILVTVNKS